MLRPRVIAASCLTTALVAFVFHIVPVASLRAFAQQQTPAAAVVADDTARGIKLYRQGDLLGAIEALRTATKYRKDDADAWLYLGLALARMSNGKDARKAFERAVKLNPNSADARTGLAYTLLLAGKVREATREAERALALGAQNAEAHYILAVARMKEHEPSNALKEAETALKINPQFAPALLLKSQALLGIYLERSFYVQTLPVPEKDAAQKRYTSIKEAAESLEQYLKLNPRAVDASLWREQLEALRAYADATDKSNPQRTVFTGSEVTTKVRIISKPEPPFTAEARRNQVTGTIVLNAIFASDGTVKHILVLSELPYGLTQKAVEAARKIKFEPATKDGRPVSMYYRIEYNFNLY